MEDAFKRKVCEGLAILFILVFDEREISFYGRCVRKHGREAAGKLAQHTEPTATQSPRIAKLGFHIGEPVQALFERRLSALCPQEIVVVFLDLFDPCMGPIGSLQATDMAANQLA